MVEGFLRNRTVKGNLRDQSLGEERIRDTAGENEFFYDFGDLN